jgi:predicted PurR-regulated permease PerM
VVFFAMLGGLAAFGPVGLVAGPLVVAFFIAISRAHSGSPRAG